ncbi:hypothetical protein ciss_14660 [Carboxydothermus islandicus]|uniref:Hydrolase n=1 Tax=Carboxydothermus islandicus TaxID=661089 RepID=A0A1L8D301_9THEO|nr:HAD family hydrolase [Carboxydothermus islandicus]GAV25533.1 hypothetical protein ciss_14660 [Carboxydothermus islandicus]
MAFILFDLDGTLLPLNLDYFLKLYIQEVKSYVKGKFDPDLTVKAILKATEEMVRNTGEKLNSEVFWESFDRIYPGTANLRCVFEDFYRTSFKNIGNYFKPHPLARPMIRYLYKKGHTLVLATNALFPKSAIIERLYWANLSPKYFRFITHYDNMHYCKPNPNYYKEILEKIKARPADCLMVGNDSTEDLVAKELGIKTFLLKDYEVKRENPRMPDYAGDFYELYRFIRENF